MKPCVIEGCPKPAGVPGTARGYCSMHYMRWSRTGDPLTTLVDLKRKPAICSVDGCEKKRWARGYCSMHLMRVRTTGEPGPAAPQTVAPSGTCIIDGCPRPVRSGIHQLCQAHYLRRLRHGDALAGKAFQRAGSVCDIDDCEGVHYARGLCHRHWSHVVGAQLKRQRKIGAPGACTPRQLRDRLAYFGNRCWVCGGIGTEVDHVKPLSKGGSNWPSNLRPACKSCNSRKRSRWFGVSGLSHIRDLVLRKVA